VLSLMGRASGGAAIWCSVGLGVAALISALAIFVWAIYVFSVAWRSAAILGAIHGIWLYFEREHWSSVEQHVRFGMLTGALLGLLAFAPSYIQTGILPSRGWLDIAIYIAAAVLGGLTAGGVNARTFPVTSRPQITSRRGRRILFACLLFLGGGALEYSCYWPSLLRKLPIASLNESSVSNLPAGDAQGTGWSGCFQYLGEYFWSSGVVGGEGGVAYVQQKDGALDISLGGSRPHLIGGAAADGRFWAGAQAPVSQGEVVRTLLKGRFVDKDHLEYSLRRTYLKNGSFGNTTRVDGTGSRCREP
jgi:hypothetical protein